MKIFNDIENSKKQEGKTNVSISQSFQKYITDNIPRYEVEIETSILRKLYHNMKDPILQQHLLNVYRRRRLHLVYKAQHPDTTMIPLKESPLLIAPKIDYKGENIANVQHTDIGRVYIYSLDEFIKYFPSLNYGHLEYVDKVMQISKAFGCQMTPEAFSVIEILRSHEELAETPLEQFQLKWVFRNAESKRDLEIILSDRNIFNKILFTIGSEFRSVLRERRFNKMFQSLFANSFLTDYIGLILIWSLDREDIRGIMFDPSKRIAAFAHIVDEIMNHQYAHYFISYKIESWLENQKIMNLSENVKIDLISMAGLHKKIPEVLRYYVFPNFIGINSNILFWGMQGAGKSGLLYAVTMWALKSNWVVIKMASVKALTWSEVVQLERHEESKLWMCQRFSKELLRDIICCNEQLLAKIPVEKETYGFYNIVGVHDKEENPVPNFYIEDRQIYFDEAEKDRSDDEREESLREQEHLKVRLREKLPNPSNLLEIAKFGLENEIYCTNCIAEILEQVYDMDSHFLLVAIDDYNWFYRPSNQPSHHYMSIKGLDGLVPPYHIDICRLFMKFDGHMIKKGFKVAGSSNHSIVKHYFEPEKINFPNEFCHKLEGVTQDHIVNFLAFCYEHALDNEKVRTPAYYKSFWTETQGNYGRIMKLLRYPDFRSLDG